MILLAILLMCDIGSRGESQGQCDYIEVNHILDYDGQHRMSQVCYWRFGGRAEPVCVGWRPIQRGLPPEFRGGYVYDTFNARSTSILTMRAPVTWHYVTYYDTEADNRKIYPIMERPAVFNRPQDGTTNLSN
jgi:hypothetical protein